MVSQVNKAPITNSNYKAVAFSSSSSSGRRPQTEGMIQVEKHKITKREPKTSNKTAKNLTFLWWLRLWVKWCCCFDLEHPPKQTNIVSINYPPKLQTKSRRRRERKKTTLVVMDSFLDLAMAGDCCCAVLGFSSGLLRTEFWVFRGVLGKLCFKKMSTFYWAGCTRKLFFLSHNNIT